MNFILDNVNESLNGVERCYGHCTVELKRRELQRRKDPLFQGLLLISRRAERRVSALGLAVLDVLHGARWAVMGCWRGSSGGRGIEAVIVV